jgi:hypothetical protein
MAANVRVRCRYIDCKHLKNLYCSLAEVTFDRKHGCLTYKPIEEEVEIEEDLVDEDELDEEDWVDLEEVEEEEEEAGKDEDYDG